MTKIDSWYREVPTIQTKRLNLRPFRISDVEELKELFGNPELYQFVGRKMTLIERNPIQLFNPKWYDAENERMLRWGIADKANDKIIGEIMIYQIDGIRRCKIGCRVCKEMWGKGIAREATITLVMFLRGNKMFPIIEADVMKGNEASIHALKKSGFILYTKRINGKFADVITDYYIYRFDPKALSKL